MQQAQMQRYRDRLITIRERLTRELGQTIESIREDIRKPGDISDVPTHNADEDVEGLELQIALGRSQRDLLTDVDDAIDRIDGGNYGRCEACHQRIASERLAAIPFTRYCIDCERRLEEASEEEA